MSPIRPASPAAPSAWACAAGDYDNDGYTDLLVTAYGKTILYHNNGDGTFTDVTDKAGVAAPGWHTSRGLVRLRQRRPARPVSVQLRRVQRQHEHRLRHQQGRPALLLHSARFQSDAVAALSQQRRRHVHPGQREAPRSQQALGKGPRRRRHRHQQRRADGPVRRQRHGAELPVRQPRQATSGRRSACLPRSPSRADGQPRSGMGVDAADLDRTAIRICSSPTSIRKCSRSIATTATRRSATTRTCTA